ncbi:hypothetical protein EVAR_43856_1 [Eumeta japonica]|uniref:Uncharacterized protein n=1 Tax=Eumeta variegata TaxID=151549 RepID=A0A4C1WZF2_EUMVA|nr:hypothetical protein EVAR_43856_1 [Eumeta japonica]
MNSRESYKQWRKRFKLTHLEPSDIETFVVVGNLTRIAVVAARKSPLNVQESTYIDMRMRSTVHSVDDDSPIGSPAIGIRTALYALLLSASGQPYRLFCYQHQDSPIGSSAIGIRTAL